MLYSCVLFVWLMVFNATFNTISAISWRSDLLVEETGGHGENNRPVTSHWQALSHNVKHLALIIFIILSYYLKLVICKEMTQFINWLYMVRIMVFNATFNNISVLLAVVIAVCRKNSPCCRKSLTNCITCTHFVVIDTDCIGSRKSNYHTNMNITAPIWIYMYNTIKI